MVVREIDLKAGGTYRYKWRHTNGTEMGMRGVYREIVPPERIVATEWFDESWYAGEALDTTVLAEERGRPTLTITVRYDSREARDGVLKTDMTEGMAAGYDRLEKFLTSTSVREGNQVRA
jgi:uncharacterized protein YndB with AHSA1/START domain